METTPRQGFCGSKLNCPLLHFAANCASMQQVNLGMIGGGTVGSGVFHALQLNGGLLSSRIGVKVAVRKVAVKAFDEPRPYEIPRAAMTTDWRGMVNDPGASPLRPIRSG